MKPWQNSPKREVHYATHNVFPDFVSFVGECLEMNCLLICLVSRQLAKYSVSKRKTGGIFIVKSSLCMESGLVVTSSTRKHMPDGWEHMLALPSMVCYRKNTVRWISLERGSRMQGWEKTQAVFWTPWSRVRICAPLYKHAQTQLRYKKNRQMLLFSFTCFLAVLQIFCIIGIWILCIFI